MARIEVVCWRVDAGRIANESPALRLAKLQANWVGQLQGGQVADINAWNDLGGELYQQVVDTDI